jgi:hypothetical protein
MTSDSALDDEDLEDEEFVDEPIDDIEDEGPLVDFEDTEE